MLANLSTNSISYQHHRDVGDRGIFVAVLWYFLSLSHFLFDIKNMTFYLRYRLTKSEFERPNSTVTGDDLVINYEIRGPVLRLPIAHSAERSFAIAAVIAHAPYSF